MKEEQIKEAYGDEFNEQIDSDGWLLYDNEEDVKQTGISLVFDFKKDESNGNLFIRPKSLQEIQCDFCSWTGIKLERLKNGHCHKCQSPSTKD